MRCPRCWKQYKYVPLRPDKAGLLLLCGHCDYTIKIIKPPENIPDLHMPEKPWRGNMQYWSGSRDNAQQVLEKDYRDGKR